MVEGPRRSAGQVDPEARGLIARMQRRAFEVTADWGDVEVPATAARVVAETAAARRVDWPDVGHLPALECPADFLDLLREWIGMRRLRRTPRSAATVSNPEL